VQKTLLREPARGDEQGPVWDRENPSPLPAAEPVT
jgi:hypothetical protein